MKTSKIITTAATLGLVIFMSVSGISNPGTNRTGEIIKGSSKPKAAAENAIAKVTSAVTTELSYLRFDVNKFAAASVPSEMPESNMDYLKFDVSNFAGSNNNEITELPETADFGYLKFDVNNFSSETKITEFPGENLSYLRFDVSRFAADNSTITEYPAE